MRLSYSEGVALSEKGEEFLGDSSPQPCIYPLGGFLVCEPERVLIASRFSSVFVLAWAGARIFAPPSPRPAESRRPHTRAGSGLSLEPLFVLLQMGFRVFAHFNGPT